MPLWLTNADAESLLSPRDYVDAVEAGYIEFGHGRVVERDPSRTHTYVATSRPDTRFCCRTIEGGIAKLDAYAVRMCSEMPAKVIVNGSYRKAKPPLSGKHYLGLVFLFSLESGELLAIIQDAYLNKMVTGATGAIGVKYLSRKDASTVGLIGSGWQAHGQIRTIATVRAIRQVKVYSPTLERRVQFAQQVSEELGVEVIPVDSCLSALEGADIVVTATNAYDAFLDGEWLEAGQHLDVMGGTDRTNKMRELCDNVFERAASVTVNSRAQAEYDQPPDILQAVQSGHLKWESILELGAVAAGVTVGRSNDGEITVHRHHTGLGLWYASAGSRLYEEALKREAGTNLADDLFTQLAPT